MIATPESGPIKYQNGSQRAMSYAVRASTFVLAFIVIPWAVWATTGHFSHESRINNCDTVKKQINSQLEKNDGAHLRIESKIETLLERTARIEAKVNGSEPR